MCETLSNFQSDIMKRTYKYLKNKLWVEMIYELRLQGGIGSVIETLKKLPKTMNSYWVLVDALDMAKTCIKQYKLNPQTNYRIFTPVEGRVNRKSFNVNQYNFELLVMAIGDEIQERN